jgi:hypothetical protein
MAESSRKRAASSPLSSESDKKPRLGLTDDEISGLNNYVRKWIAMAAVVFADYDKWSAADVNSGVLAATLHQIACALTTYSSASSLDKGWLDVRVANKRIDELPHDQREDIKFAWVEARNKGWENLVGHGALLT